MKKIIGNPEEKNNKNIKIINKIKINNYYIKNQEDFRIKIVNSINIEDYVLDIGKSSRQFYDKIKSKKLITLDNNDFGDYPDIIFDICEEVDDSLKDNATNIETPPILTIGI